MQLQLEVRSFLFDHFIQSINQPLIYIYLDKEDQTNSPSQRKLSTASIDFNQQSQLQQLQQQQQSEESKFITERRHSKRTITVGVCFFNFLSFFLSEINE